MQLLQIFSTKFIIFTKEDSGHICSKFHHNIWFDLKITTTEIKSTFFYVNR